MGYLKPIQAPRVEEDNLSQLEWSAPASGGVPLCLGRRREVQGTFLVHANFIWKLLNPWRKEQDKGRGALPLRSLMIPECWLGTEAPSAWSPGGPSWEVQARWVLSTQPQGWAGAQGRHGAGWPVVAAAAASGVHSGSVHGTRSWRGHPGSWERHCMGAEEAADCGQGPEWNGRRCPRGQVMVVSCRPWNHCCWGYAPVVPPHSCRAS